MRVFFLIVFFLRHRPLENEGDRSINSAASVSSLSTLAKSTGLRPSTQSLQWRRRHLFLLPKRCRSGQHPLPLFYFIASIVSIADLLETSPSVPPLLVIQVISLSLSHIFLPFLIIFNLVEYYSVVTLLDYGAGNVRSVRNAIRRLGFDVKDVIFLDIFCFCTWLLKIASKHQLNFFIFSPLNMFWLRIQVSQLFVELLRSVVIEFFFFSKRI